MGTNADTKQDDYFGDDPGDEVTAANALLVVAKELRFIRRTLYALTFDPNGETAIAGLASSVEEVAAKLEGTDDTGSKKSKTPDSLADVLARIAEALEAR